jgi:hypothetical protein
MRHVQKRRTRSRVGRKKALKKKAIGGRGVKENLNPRIPEPTSNPKQFQVNHSNESLEWVVPF